LPVYWWTTNRTVDVALYALTKYSILPYFVALFVQQYFWYSSLFYSGFGIIVVGYMVNVTVRNFN